MRVKILSCALAAVFVMILILPLSSCGTVDPPKNVYDYADLLSDADEQRVQSIAENVGEAAFFVATHNSTNSFDSLIGEELLDRWGYSYSDSIVVLVITLDNHTYYYDIYTYGTAAKRISDDEVDDILGAPTVKTNIKNGRLAAGIEAFAEKTEQAMSAPWVLIVIIAIASGLLVATAVCASVRAKYKMRRQPTNYPLEKYAKMELTDRSDEFITSRVSVQVVSSSSSRGGGRSGGGRGGGGGHRGGR